jgi:hypothetical protein
VKFQQLVEYFFCISTTVFNTKTKCYEKKFNGHGRDHIHLLAVAYSQKNILTGKITDEKRGAPLMGASIYIPDLKVGVRANEDGSLFHVITAGR